MGIASSSTDKILQRLDRIEEGQTKLEADLREDISKLAEGQTKLAEGQTKLREDISELRDDVNNATSVRNGVTPIKQHLLGTVWVYSTDGGSMHEERRGVEAFEGDWVEPANVSDDSYIRRSEWLMTAARDIAKQRAVHVSVTHSGDGAPVRDQYNGVVMTRTKMLTAGHCVLDARAHGPRYHFERLLYYYWSNDNWSYELVEKCSPQVRSITVIEGRDMAVVEFDTTIFPQLPPLRLFNGSIALGSSAVANTLFCEKGERTVHSTRLDHNGSNENGLEYFQGPGRTGHSGCGIYNSDGCLIGIMSSGSAPRNSAGTKDTVRGSDDAKPSRR